jgi:hypothetical protein
MYIYSRPTRQKLFGLRFRIEINRRPDGLTTVGVRLYLTPNSLITVGVRYRKKDHCPESDSSAFYSLQDRLAMNRSKTQRNRLLARCIRNWRLSWLTELETCVEYFLEIQ